MKGSTMKVTHADIAPIVRLADILTQAHHQALLGECGRTRAFGINIHFCPAGTNERFIVNPALVPGMVAEPKLVGALNLGGAVI